MTDVDNSFEYVAGEVTTLPENRIISGFWRRFLAFSLDSIFIGILGFTIGACFFDFFAQMGGYGRLVGFCIALAYFGLLNSCIGNGQTLGKKIMKIEVVNRNGEYISLGRSLIRYTIFSIPFFLNGLIVSPSITHGPIGYIIGYAIFGVGGAIIYLYIFNRHSRQSLHDLVVKSFVVKSGMRGEVGASAVWSSHLVIVGLWFCFVILSYLIPVMTFKDALSELIALQKSIQSTGKVHTSSAMIGKGWVSMNGEQWEETSLRLNAIWKTRPEDYEAAASEVASLALSEYPKVMDKDFLIVSVTYGFDMGIAYAWNVKTFHYRPEEWIEVLEKEGLEGN